jgi:hypothetical protein
MMAFQNKWERHPTCDKDRVDGELALEDSSSSSSSSSPPLGSTARREPWPPMLFASTGLYPEISFSILQSPSLADPLERHLAI